MDNNNNDDDDDNEKQSKINRQSRGFLRKAVLLMTALTIFASALGIASSKDPPQLISDIEGIQIDDLLAHIVDELDTAVRARKNTRGVIMETDPKGLELTKALQAATLDLLEHRYGYNTSYPTFRVKVDLVYPQSILKQNELPTASFVIEMAPPNLIPCSVFYFLEIARTYTGGMFHRNANHVLQAAASSEATKGHKPMPFQEYSPKHPHAKYTTGYAGRPSGPGWYVSIRDNTNNHGPGSQQKHNPYEADSNFGRIVEGIEEGVIDKIHSVPQDGWLDPKNCVQIASLTILVPLPDGEWGKWEP
eukprot:jgi/Psemu1/320376/estExt_fgenesh1_pm.C_5280002